MNDNSRRSSTPVRGLVVELVIIIAGVLMALAIDEWWTNLEESDRADIYIQQLIADLRTTEETFAQTERWLIEATSAAESLLVIFEENGAADLEQVYELLNELEPFNNPAPVLGTIEVLISTGDLRVIRDANVRIQITAYLSYVRDFWLTPLSEFETSHRELEFRLRVLAAKYGISPNPAGRPSRDSENVNVAGFIADDEAYAVLAELVKIKETFAMYSTRVSQRSSELRILLGET